MRAGGVQEAVGDVDLQRIRTHFVGYHQDRAEDAQARAVLLYSFIFGQSLLFLEQAPRKRASLTAACTVVLTDF